MLAAALLVAPAAAAAAQAIPPGAQNCGTIIIPPGIGAGTGADITSFNPILASSLYNQEAAELLFTQLIWIAPDHSIDYARSLVSAIATPDSGTTYQVTLRPWHWSDGVPLTAADVLYTFNYAKSLGDTWPGFGTGGMPDIVASFTIQDPLHFTLTLKRQVNPTWFILNGLSSLVVVPAHVWGKFNPDQIWQNQSSPAFFQVVDGPLILKKLTVGQDAEFTPNPDYAGPPLHFTRLVMKFMNSEDAELQAVESNDLDMANIPFPLFDMARHIPGLHVVTLPPLYGWNEIVPNMANRTTPYFADLRVRQAIADAINQKQVIALAMHGNGDEIHSAIPVEPPTFLSPAARAGDFPIGYDPQKARLLLAQAGFTPGPDGIMQKFGMQLAFTILVPAGQEMRIEMIEVVQQNLRAVGIDMKVRQVEFNHVLALLDSAPQSFAASQAWQAILLGSTLSAFPSGEGNFNTGGYYNDNGYSNAQMDSDITESTDKPGLAGLFAYEDFTAAQQPVIFLPEEKYSILARDGLHGISTFISPIPLWAPDALYCTAEPQA
jgi:peptide/nickel transport system substrate-binding protein